MNFDEMDKIMGVDDKWLTHKQKRLKFLYKNYSDQEIKSHLQTLIDFMSGDKGISVEQYQAARDRLEDRKIPL